VAGCGVRTCSARPARFSGAVRDAEGWDVLFVARDHQNHLSGSWR